MDIDSMPNSFRSVVEYNKNFYVGGDELIIEDRHPITLTRIMQ